MSSTGVWWGAALACVAAVSVRAEVTFMDFEQPPHRYFERTPTDPFAQRVAALESGTLPLDRSSEKAFLESFLRAFEIPASSQMWVFSTTSLQLRLISPSNPRALYFNEDVYVGYIPGGRLEVASIDPELGAVFHIFDVPRGEAPIRTERATRCMNCHAGEDTGFVPGLAVKSVVPGPGGGSLNAFRRGRTGHDIPLSERFGGWHVTGLDGFTNHWGNTVGDLVGGQLQRQVNLPGQKFRADRYLVGTSDVLPHLVHEHQVGFINRVVEGTYRTRTHWHTDGGKLTEAHRQEVEEQAKRIVRYLLFAEEAPLPPGGVVGDPTFKADFLRQRKAVDGVSLKDFDLSTRLFKYRCSYMIYRPVFTEMPGVLRDRVLEQLNRALRTESGEPEFDYLPAAEKQTIRRILRSTLPELTAGW